MPSIVLKHKNYLLCAVGTHVCMVEVKETQTGPQFLKKDQYTLKGVPCALQCQDLDSQLLITCVYSNSHVKQFTFGGDDHNQREIPHRFNFKFKATAIESLSVSTFAVLDQSKQLYIFNQKMHNLLYSDKKAVSMLTCPKKTLVLTEDGICQLHHISVSDVVKHLISKN